MKNKNNRISKIAWQILVDANLNPLIERRDYVPLGHDILEQNALALEQENKLPRSLKKQLKKRLQPFPARQTSLK